MSRECETYPLTDDPRVVAHTAADRVPFLSNVGDVDLVVDIEPWPMRHPLTLRPGATTAFPSPLPPTDACPIFAKAKDSGTKAEVEVLYLR